MPDIKTEWETEYQVALSVAICAFIVSVIFFIVAIFIWRYNFGWSVISCGSALILIGAAIKAIFAVKTLNRRFVILKKLEDCAPDTPPLARGQYCVYLGGLAAFATVSKNHDRYSKNFQEKADRFLKTKWLLEHYIDEEK